MHWLFTRPEERNACRRVKRLGGSFVVFGCIPFTSHVTSVYLRETTVVDDEPNILGFNLIDTDKYGFKKNLGTTAQSFFIFPQCLSFLSVI